MRFLIFVSLTVLSPLTYAIDSKLSCKVFVNAMPKADLEISFSGTNPVQKSTVVTTKTGKFRVELSWEGYYERIPRNPEMRIQHLSSDEKKIILEAYKNFDLQKYVKEESSQLAENDDNIGVRAEDEVIYLSCDYLKDRR